MQGKKMLFTIHNFKFKYVSVWLILDFLRPLAQIIHELGLGDQGS